MIHFIFNDNDNRYLFLKGDNSKDITDIRKLMKSVNLIDPVCLLQSYKGPIFTNDYIWEYTQKNGGVVWYCSIGLWQIIYSYLKKNNINFDGLDPNRFKKQLSHTFDEFKNIVKSWNLKFEPRPYQYETAYKILQWNRSVTQAATRAGKTLIAYMVFRYAIEYLRAKKLLMIVPSIDLVKQGYSDFNEYGEFFKTECVWAGGKLVEGTDLTIGTFQSLIKFLDKKSSKYNPNFFNQFDVVFCDEVHRSTAQQTKTIITQPFIKNCKIIFGMTGTLPKEGTSERFGVHSLLGAKIQTITPKELQDAGYISKVKIYQVRLHYIDEEKQLNEWISAAEYVISDYITHNIKKPDGTYKTEKLKLEHPNFLYQYEKRLPDIVSLYKKHIKLKHQNDELGFKLEYKKYIEKMLSLSTKGNKLVIEKMMVHQFTERVDYLLKEIIPKCDKNTLILAHHTSYIKYIVTLLKERFPNKIIETVIGTVNAKKREEIRLMMKESNNVIIVASYACMSTGITLTNLCYGVFFESFKSNVVNMQSIGRGLGLSNMKDEYILYDINDCFNRKAASNKLELQANEKQKIYQNKENQYPYEVININIGEKNKCVTKYNRKQTNIVTNSLF